MAEKWKIVAGVSAGVILFHIIDAIVYAWTADAEGLDCFNQGKKEGKYLLNLFINSGGEAGNMDLLRPTNDTDLNNCQMAYQHGYAVGVTLPAGVAAFVGSVAYGALSQRKTGSVPA